MGDGAALPVGVPVPWPLATPPNGWLKYNGAAFDKAKFPKLAAVYASGKLPDLRGEFIRGWDDGRGIDGARVLLSSQSHLFAKHAHRFEQTWGATGFDGTSGMYVVGADFGGEVTPVASVNTNSVGGDETRPRNVAFNYIVRAA